MRPLSSIPPRPRHSFEDHTAEVRLRVEASDLASLFEEAGRALAELMLDTPADENPDLLLTITLTAPSRESLLVEWLNELIFLSETRKRVYTDVRVTRISDTALEAEVRGVFPEKLRTAVKAATLHELSVHEGPNGYDATVVLDV